MEDKKGTTVATLFEKWDESLHYVIGGNFGKRSLTPEYQTRYNVTQFSITLYEITPRLKVSIDSIVFLLTPPFTKP